MKLNNIRYTDEDINNLDDYFSKEIEEYKKIEQSLIKEINKQKQVIDKIKEMILKVNDDEFYVNLSNKEKILIDILKLLEEINE